MIKIWTILFLILSLGLGAALFTHHAGVASRLATAMFILLAARVLYVQK